MSENINTIEDKKVKGEQKKALKSIFEKLLNEPMVKVNGSEVWGSSVLTYILFFIMVTVWHKI